MERAHAPQGEPERQRGGRDPHGASGTHGGDRDLVLLTHGDLEGGGEGREVLQLGAAQLLDQLLRAPAASPHRHLPRLHPEHVDAGVEHLRLPLLGGKLQAADDREVGEHVRLRDAGQARPPVQPHQREAVLEQDTGSGYDHVIAVGDDVIGGRQRREQPLDESLVYGDQNAVRRVGEQRPRLRLRQEAGQALDLPLDRVQRHGRGGRGGRCRQHRAQRAPRQGAQRPQHRASPEEERRAHDDEQKAGEPEEPTPA